MPGNAGLTRRRYRLPDPVTGEKPLENFRVHIEYNDALYKCSACLSVRIYGKGEPDNSGELVFLNCRACNKHTHHFFVGVHKGRSENKC